MASCDAARPESGSVRLRAAPAAPAAPGGQDSQDSARRVWAAVSDIGRPRALLCQLWAALGDPGRLWAAAVPARVHVSQVGRDRPSVGGRCSGRRPSQTGWYR